MTTYSYVQLDPRPAAVNPEFDYGIEITVPTLLLEQTNLDHHGQGATSQTPSAAEQALTAALPQAGSVLATVRSDADSVTAMAIFASRETGRRINKAIVTGVGKLDRLGPQARTRCKYAPIAIGRVSADYRRPLADRVAFVQSVLDGSVDPTQIKILVAEREAEFKAAVKASIVCNNANGRIAVVVSTHRFATEIGYQRATVVVATNPKMPVFVGGKPDPSGATYLKHTVCQHNEFVGLNMAGIVAELNAIDPGWGGLPNIKGSPQNIGSKLTTEQVVEIVSRHLPA